MKRHIVISLIRLALAALAFTAIVVQMLDSLERGRSIANFFSFFTIESNILAAGILLILGVAGFIGVKRKGFEYLRGAATLYMSMTGIIYVLLLSGNEVALQTTLPWVNMVLHYIMPVAVVIDWLANPPASALSYKKALWWIVFPVGYLLYSFIRGPIVGWYPYPFMNPLVTPWPTIIVICIVIALGTLGLIRLLTVRRKNKR